MIEGSCGWSRLMNKFDYKILPNISKASFTLRDKLCYINDSF